MYKQWQQKDENIMNFCFRKFCYNGCLVWNKQEGNVLRRTIFITIILNYYTNKNFSKLLFYCKAKCLAGLNI